jgi:hypothetical protein
MKRGQAGVAFFLGVALCGSVMALGGAASQQRAILSYEGQIRSVKIDKCGLQPGSCEGSLVLATQERGEVALAVKPGTWIKRGTNLVTIDELGVGNYVKVQAVEIPGEAASPRAWFIDGGD